MKSIIKAKHLIKNYGLKYYFSRLILRLIYKSFSIDHMSLAKEKIRVDANSIFKNIISHGPFKGMILSDQVWWGKYDLVSKYLGQYEEHVLLKLKSLSSDYSHFVDIGAGDGYYSVGVLKSKMYSTSTAFEISKKGREVIKINAKLNNIEKNLEIKEEANELEISKEIEKHGPSVILCDIEGSEFDLFDEKIFQKLNKSTVIIELHDSFLKNFSEKRKRMISLAEKYFEISFLERTSPNINKFNELSEWNDDDRMLAFSEGRPVRMEWVVLIPKT